jgi:hypothetical protein
MSPKDQTIVDPDDDQPELPEDETPDTPDTPDEELPEPEATIN